MSASTPDNRVEKTGATPSGRTPDTGDLRTRERQEGWSVPLDPIDAFTLGAPLSVEPDRIEQALAALWRKAAERAESAGAGARFTVTRACLWNFIVHSDGEEEFQRTKRMIDELSESVPARIINLYESWETEGALIGNDGSLLRASIEANFRRSGSGRREVVSEEITLEAPRIHAHRLPALVRSLLLADVPTALLVRNPAADVHWLPRLAKEAERFIFDSGKLPSGAALHRVHALLARIYGHTPVEIADLGWLRLWPWRILLASLFDASAAIAALSKLEAVEIHHCHSAEPAALLLAGWLRGRLRLSPGKLHLHGLPAHAAASGPVGIERVLLRCGPHQFLAHAVGDGRCICLTSPFQPERAQPVHGRKDAELMVAAMGVGGRDPLMYEALRLGAELVRATSE